MATLSSQSQEGFLASVTTLPDGNAIRTFIASRRLSPTNETIADLLQLAQSEMRKNPPRSLALAEAGLLFANNLQDGHLIAQGSRITANALVTLGDYQKALDLYFQALSIYRSQGDREGIARTLSASIQPRNLLGRYDEALAVCAEARSLFLDLGDSRRLAMLENNEGNVFHRQGRFEEALQSYQLAYDLLVANGDSENLMVSFNNLATCLIALNDFSRALSFYERARNLSDAVNIPSLGAIAEYNIAYLYYLRGRYGLALSLLSVARERSNELSDPRLRALCDLDQSEIYIELNLSREALASASEAFESCSKAGLSYEAAQARANQAIATGQLGLWEKSLQLFADARERFAAEANSAWPHLIDAYRAVLTAKQGKYCEAIRLSRAATEFFERSSASHRRMRVACHLTLARCLLASGDLTGARGECEKVNRILNDVDSPLLRYQMFALFGQLERATGSLDSAYHAFLSAKSEVETLRASLDRDELRISFMSDKTTVTESLVAICLQRSDPASVREAFTHVQLVKSRCLADDLRFQMDRRRDQIGTSQPGFQIRDEWNWLRHRIQLENLRLKGASVEHLETLESECSVRLRGLTDQSSLAASRRDLLTDPATEKLSQCLPPGAALVEYFTVGDELFAFVAVGERLFFRRLDFSQCVKHLRSFHFQLDKAAWSSQRGEKARTLDLAATRSHLRELYRQLLEPIRDLIPGNLLIIAPHGTLHQVPFHALFDGTRYVVDSFVVSYAPSATVFRLCQELPLSHTRSVTVLGVANDRAPFIVQEANAVHTMFKNSTLLTGTGATRTAFEAAGRTGGLLHVATHSVFRGDNPGFSGLYLGDGFLHLYELREMCLSLDLLVLSGCGSGASVIEGEDEQLGLVRGAILAGTRSVLASLWNVHDQSTMHFMRLFYESLLETNSKAQALRKGMIELRQELPHPFFWAPFYLAGAVS